jgi:aminoglycoside 6'-N-acetyltransferase
MPEVGRWWGPVPDDFPLGDEPEATRFTIVVEGRIAGMVQFGEENDPDWRHGSIDIFLAPDFHGRGIGTEAVRRVIRVLVDERGHHRVTIDPAADNAAAIRCYEKAGFRAVGVMRKAWRDGDGLWRDILLMELVVD